MFDLEKLVNKVIKAVEIDQWTTYEQIAKEAGITTVSLWRIRKKEASTTLKTANKIAWALEKLKKDKKSI